MAKTIRVGDDQLTPDAGQHESMNCVTCGTAMDVERNQDRYSRYGVISKEASKVISKCDIFTCQHAGKDWHEQIIALKRHRDESPSSFLRKIYEDEIAQITATQTATVSRNWTIFD